MAIRRMHQPDTNDVGRYEIHLSETSFKLPEAGGDRGLQRWFDR
jgi:hypothetical protein